MESERKDRCCPCQMHNYCVSWNSNKEAGCSDNKWRRIQIRRFLADYPGCSSKHSKVFKWIRSHTPNPWPQCSANVLGKVMKRLSNGYTIVSNIARWDEISIFPQ